MSDSVAQYVGLAWSLMLIAAVISNTCGIYVYVCVCVCIYIYMFCAYYIYIYMYMCVYVRNVCVFHHPTYEMYPSPS